VPDPPPRFGIRGKGSRSGNQWGLGGEVRMGVEAFFIEMEKGPDLFRPFIHIVEGISGDNMRVAIDDHDGFLWVLYFGSCP